VASCRDVRLAAEWTGGGLLLPRDSDTMDRGLRRL
jgi:hypothetical protein